MLGRERTHIKGCKRSCQALWLRGDQTPVLDDNFKFRIGRLARVLLLLGAMLDLTTMSDCEKTELLITLLAHYLVRYPDGLERVTAALHDCIPAGGEQSAYRPGHLRLVKSDSA